MNSSALATGMVVSFGRSHGEHTLGEVLKVNRKNVKVVQLEPRGTRKSHGVGSVWMVPANMVTRAKADPARVRAGRKAAAGVKKAPAKVVEINRSPARVEDDCPTYREVVLNSAKVPLVSVTPVRGEQGCPVLIDPDTGYHFVGHKGEGLVEFALRVVDVIARHP